MAHTHSVYDNDTHFKIDPATRLIENTTGKVILMQNDHNSERFTFEIPRYVDGHDMSECNVIEVHYVNAAADRIGKSEGVYEVTDMQLSPSDEEVVIFSWLISQDATQHAGTLHFMLRFACVTDTEIDYQWFSGANKEFSISEGLFAKGATIGEYTDNPDVIIGGTTPTHIFKLPFDTSTVAEVRVVYAQDGDEVVKKKTADCVMDGNEIAVTLTQMDTLALQEKTSVQIQLRVLTVEGTALTSGVNSMTVEKSLNAEVLE